MTDDALPPADLVTHAGFVRRLAFHLLRDDADADDAAQETLARALERPPRAGPGVRAWLATVLRNVVRKDGRGSSRRARREAAVARPEGGRAGDDAAAREEILRSVTEAVASLDVSQREVVLLRHYEDLPPRDIAARLGVPVETVKSRIKRAHATLRARLDERRAGNVEGWRSSLAGALGFGMPGGGLVGPRSPARATPATIAAAVALVGLATAGAWLALRLRVGAARPPPAAAGALARADDAVPAPPPGLRAPRAAPPSPAAPPAAPPVATTPPGWTRVRTGAVSIALPPEWRPAPADALTATWTEGTPPVGTGTSFSVVLSHYVPMYETNIEKPARSAVTVAGRPATRTEGNGKNAYFVVVRFDAPKAGEEAPGIGFLSTTGKDTWPAYEETLAKILASVEWAAAMEIGTSETAVPSPEMLRVLETDLPAGTVGGTVLHGTKPVSGAVATLFRPVADLFAPASSGGPPARIATTDEAGRFTFEGLEMGTWGVRVDAGDLGSRRLQVVLGARERPRRWPIVHGTASLEGRVFLRTGLPAAGVTVSACPHGGYSGAFLAAEAVAADDGSWRLPALTPGSWTLRARLVPGIGLPSDERTEVATLVAGRTVVRDLGTDRPEPEWRGGMRLSSGSLVRGPGPFVVLAPVAGQGLLSTAPDGQGRIAQRLPAGTYRGTAARPLFVERTLMFELVVGPQGIEQEVAVPGVRVSGAVRDAAPPQPGAPATTVHIAKKWEPHAPSAPARSDGTFDAYAVPAGKHVCWAVQGDRTSPEVEIDVPADRDLDGVVLVLPAP